MSTECLAQNMSRYARILETFHGMEEEIEFSILDGNQLYFVFPDEIVDGNLKNRVFGLNPLDYAEIKTCSFLRLLFLRSDHRFLDPYRHRTLIIEFQPSSIKSTSDVPAEPGTDSLLSAGPEAPEEIGSLFNIIEVSQEALGTISRLMNDPLSLGKLEHPDGPAVEDRIRQVSDQFLHHLSCFSTMVAKSQQMPAEKWRAAVREELIKVILSLTEAYELSGTAYDEKLAELENFRLSIDDYLNMVDPETDGDEILKLGSCVNALVLDSRQNTLRKKIERTDDKIDQAFLDTEKEVLSLIPHGAIMPEVPRVIASRAARRDLKLTLSFAHLMIASRLGGLSVRIDFSGARNLAPDYRGGGPWSYPQLHICNHSRFASFASIPNGLSAGPKPACFA